MKTIVKLAAGLIVFDDPGQASYQRMNGELVPVQAAFRPAGQLELTTMANGEAGRPFATLTTEQRTPDRLSLHGTLHERSVTITLGRVDPSVFTLRSRGFHWVQDSPYFR